MKKILLLVLAAVLAVAGVSGTASAQANSADKFGTSAWGNIIPVWNTIDSVIVDGSLVVIDTTATIKRLGIRPYLPASTVRTRVLGIAVGDIARSSRGGAGKVLLYGYHPRARVGASSGVAAGAVLKPSLSIAHSFALGDSISGSSAYVIGGNAGAFSGSIYKYKVWFHGYQTPAVTL